LKKFFGISLDDYNRMVEAQNGCCSICRQPETSKFRGKTKRLSVDHDHQTGRVRALLCAQCNVALGCAKENVAYLMAMVRYLRHHADVANPEMREYVAYCSELQ
jgi:hypothetical protein